MKKTRIMMDWVQESGNLRLEDILEGFYGLEEIISQEHDEPLMSYVLEGCITRHVSIIEQVVRFVCAESINNAPSQEKQLEMINKILGGESVTVSTKDMLLMRQSQFTLGDICAASRNFMGHSLVAGVLGALYDGSKEKGRILGAFGADEFKDLFEWRNMIVHSTVQDDKRKWSRAYVSQMQEKIGNIITLMMGALDSVTRTDEEYEIRAYGNKATALSRKNDHDQALTYAKKALKINAKSARACLVMGSALLNSKEYKDAVKYYDMALQINDELFTAYNNKGVALSNMGEHKSAVECYHKAISINSQNATIYNNAGISLGRLGKNDESLRMYDRALEVDSNLASAHFGKGNALAMMNRYDEALSMYDRALEIDPQGIHMYNNIGNVLAMMNRYDEALSMYDRALEIDSQNHMACMNKGIAFEEMGKYKDALEMYDRALEIDPNYNAARNNKDRVSKKLK